MRILLLLLITLCNLSTQAQTKSFRFAFISDTHIGSPNGNAEEDLRRTISDINKRKDIAFVVITGDITELGTNKELLLAKQILDSLNIAWYIIPGNHDTGWSESGGVMYTSIFGYDKFSFEYNGIRFLGCASGPYVRMSDGHVPRDAVNWLDEELKKVKKNQPVIFLNHYPLDNGLDNWYEVTDRLRKHNTWVALCGHGHNNKAMSFDGIPGVMGRSNLRAKEPIGAYNIVNVSNDSIVFLEKKPGEEAMRKWTTVAVGLKKYDSDEKFPRPDYSMNEKNAMVKRQWTVTSDANIISTPAVTEDKVFVGNQNGKMNCYSIKTGKELWSFNTSGSIFSSPAVNGNSVVFGSGDGSVYCLNINNGKLLWKKEYRKAVLGTPLLHGDTIFIGGSEPVFEAINIHNGKSFWSFYDFNGAVVSKPLLYDNKIIFGAWDKHLYALNSTTGKLEWKWNNGTAIINYSPAACIPVAANGAVFIVAPDRYVTSIDATNGKTLWRSNDAKVRESIGISEDRKWIYGKTMQDTVAVYQASREKQIAAKKINCGFGYEHVPSMLVELNGLVYFGTKNGVVYCLNPTTQNVVWTHKIDNSMVNTINVINDNSLVAATMDGKMVLLKY